MKTMYIANDGKNFDDFTACREYEEELERKNAEKKRREEEKDEAFKDVLKKKCEYMDALNNYNAKYNSYEYNYKNLSVDFSDLRETLKKLGLM